MKKFIGLIFLSLLLLTSGSLFAKEKQTNRLEMTLYFSRHCGACMRLEHEYIPGILKKYGDKIDLAQKEIGEEKNLKELLEVNPEGSVPTMVIAGNVYVGVDEIEKNVTSIIEDFIAGKLKMKKIEKATNLNGKKKL